MRDLVELEAESREQVRNSPSICSLHWRGLHSRERVASLDTYRRRMDLRTPLTGQPTGRAGKSGAFAEPAVLQRTIIIYTIAIRVCRNRDCKG